MTRFRNLFGPALVLGLLAACSDPSGPDGEARIRVLLTDAPSDYIESAEVHITRIYMQGGEDEDAAAVDLFNDPDNPLVYDLLELRDGVTADMTGEVEVEPGNYKQLRLVVAHATVTLAEGYTFNGGGTEQTLTIPSGAQSGIKIQLSSDIEAEEGATTTILVDFDVDQNFVIQGNPETPAGINGILFTPSLHEKSRDTEES